MADAGYKDKPKRCFFTLTAENHARSLAHFYCQYAHRHINLNLRAGNSTIFFVNKQIDVS